MIGNFSSVRLRASRLGSLILACRPSSTSACNSIILPLQDDPDHDIRAAMFRFEPQITAHFHPSLCFRTSARTSTREPSALRPTCFAGFRGGLLSDIFCSTSACISPSITATSNNAKSQKKKTNRSMTSPNPANFFFGHRFIFTIQIDYAGGMFPLRTAVRIMSVTHLLVAHHNPKGAPKTAYELPPSPAIAAPQLGV